MNIVILGAGLMGLAGAPHCAVMCGARASTALAAPPKRRSGSAVAAGAAGDGVRSPMQATVVKLAVAGRMTFSFG